LAIETSDTRPAATHWVLPVIGGLLLAVAGEGPDFGHYADWAGAALHGDIFDLRGNVLSPIGVPFTIASAGTGLLFAAGKAALFPLPFPLASVVTGWLAAVTFWASALVVLRHCARGADWIAMFGAGVLFVGTHAGLYSHAYATEVFADALIALVWAIALTRDRWRLVDCAAVGALAGLLFLVRPHVLMYAAPALWLAAFAGASEDRRLLRLAIMATPLALAAAQYGIVNRWMTGTPWHPPYVYGAEGFSSVDMMHPEIAAVLFHPWHGLLAYHPVYAVAFAAVAIAAWRGGPQQVWWWTTALAVIAHVWVQGGWYIWWLGGSTFGMRGMAPAALPLVAGLVTTIRQDVDAHARRATTWLWLSLIACSWSYPLLMQGNSRYLSWPALMSAQPVAIAASVLLLGTWAYWAARHRKPSVITGGDAAGLARTFALVLLAATVAYLAWQFSIRPAPITRMVKGSLGAALLFGALHAATTRRARLRDAVMVAVLFLFVLQAGLFGRLAIRTEQRVAAGAAPPRAFDYIGASPVDELRTSYAEYLEVSGFADRKAAFRRFLAWQRVHLSRMSPADRDIAENFRHLVDVDPAFDELLVEVTATDGLLQISATGITDTQELRARALAAQVPGARSVIFLRH